MTCCILTTHLYLQSTQVLGTVTMTLQTFGSVPWIWMFVK